MSSKILNRINDDLGTIDGQYILQNQIEDDPLFQEADFLKVLEALTRALPDDTALQSLALEGNRLRAQGLSDNASRVQELLGKEPGFENVRLPSAITREGRSNKESFVLEAELNPAIFTLWQLPQNTAQPAAAP